MAIVTTAWMPRSLDRRERVFLSFGGAALLVFLIYLFVPAEADPVAATPTPAAVPSFHEPAPPPPPPAPAGPPPASVSGLTLHGVLGGGAAVIGFPDGAQRAVPLGREFLPGLTLKEVALHHVLIATASGDTRLEFNKPASTASADRTERAPESQSRERETLEFRTGLAPYSANGRIAGFAVRPGAKLDVLKRAGLRPGDVIVAVNGQAFRSEEKVLELSAELANSHIAEIEYLRGGRRLKGKVRINDAPSG